MDENLLNTINNHILSLLETMIIYGLAYSARVLAGKHRVETEKISWSWERFWHDMIFRLGIAYSMFILCIIIDLISYFAPLMGWNLPPDVTDFLNSGLLINIPFIAALAETYKALKLHYKVFNYKGNLKTLNLTEDEYDKDAANYEAVAKPLKEGINYLSGLKVIHDNEKMPAGEYVREDQAQILVELGAYPYYRVNCETPELFYKAVIGKGFDEGFGDQCVAGFKEFCVSLCGDYVSAGGSALLYANELVIRQVEKLGLKWHKGSSGLQDGDWGVWTTGEHGHISMKYGDLWLGQNQGAEDPNKGNPFNLCKLPTYGLVGYYRPDIYEKKEIVEETEKVKPTENGTITYTYQKGDTFGAVISKLGLKTSYGLWGENGDVTYYTKQLKIKGNIPIGTTLRFKKRTD